MNIFEQYHNWLVKLQNRLSKRKYLRYTRNLEQVVRSHGPDSGLFTCTVASRINRKYGMWYRDKLEEHFQRLGESYSPTPFHRFVGYKLKRWERDEVVYELRLQFISKLIEELECPHTPLSYGPLLQ